MSLLSPVKHPKLWGCYVICISVLSEEVFNIVRIERLIFVLCTRQQGSILVEYLIYCISCIYPYGKLAVLDYGESHC